MANDRNVCMCRGVSLDLGYLSWLELKYGGFFFCAMFVDKVRIELGRSKWEEDDVGVVGTAWYHEKGMFRIFVEKKMHGVVWVSHGIDLVESWDGDVYVNKSKSSWTGGVVGDMEHRLD